MRNRVLLTAGAVVLAAASCAQPEPQVLSEAPRSTSADDVASPTETTEREEEPGRFIARCATEADGGTPGMTYFTDGSQNVTDHCLSRYYIGVQPAPGALYVPDDQAGSDAPTRGTTTQTPPSPEWTPAQPRTDAGPTDEADEDRDAEGLEDDERVTGEDGDPEAGEPGGADDDGDDAATPTDDPDTTTPSTPPEDTTTPASPPAPTTPGTPDADEPTAEESGPFAPPASGSSAPGEPPAGPAGAGQPQPGTVPQAPPSASADPWGSLGSAAREASVGSQNSLVLPDVLPDLQWPAPALPGSGPTS